jgi:hypothetical protein
MTKGKKPNDTGRAVSPINGQPIPNGRPKGVPNKKTILAREAIAQFVDGNADKLEGWLEAIGRKDPEAAFKAFMSVVEYHIPKLQRTTLDAGEGSEGEIIYRWKREDE